MDVVNFEKDIVTRRMNVVQEELNHKRDELLRIDKNINELMTSKYSDKERLLGDLKSEKEKISSELNELRANFELLKTDLASIETKRKNEDELRSFTYENFEDNPKVRNLMEEPNKYMGLEQIDNELYPLIDSDSVKKYYDDGVLPGKVNVVKRKQYFHFKQKDLIAVIKYHRFGVKPNKKKDTAIYTERTKIEIPKVFVDTIGNMADDLGMTSDDILLEAITLFKEKIQFNLITEKERLLEKIKKIEEKIYSLYNTTE